MYIFDKIELLDEDFADGMFSLLSAERRLKVQRLRPGIGRNASAVAYLLLRLALREVYNINEPVEFRYASKGKPALRNFSQIFFNLSHSKGAAVCSVAGFEVGVDVQRIRRVTDRTAKRVLSPLEFEEFKASDNTDEYFCKLWAIKESYLKMTGQGITSEVRDVLVDDIKNVFSFEENGYYYSVCGSSKPLTDVKRIGREYFEQLR